MEIEFNTRRITRADYGQPAARHEAVQADPGAGAPSFAKLKAQIDSAPAADPGKVDRAKALVSGAKYPPNDVLDRIAHLLAIHTKQED